ncbi:cytochrome c biogenesis CcdA family protein [Paraburkholderia gardini]|uniref:Protein DipZ n=1 Tax=Paraburkholderia gardini TaxID=2823469 RepID=A0ABM8TYN2_9BURK|nr:cytochrome c biogenesis CcdA family protein [Paraburkholderia gardini]CAG4888992.1 Protein DipZ [Paraburkholderia gardini]CAG4896524.1 Protein DipZ [Paraburkholderia gardini]
MDFGVGTYATGFVAGAASSLSPCVLPLLPILVASALSTHRFGAVALATGLSLSFAAVGIFVATLGASIGLDPETFRRVAAILMIVFGLVMLSARLQDMFARATSRLSGAGQSALGGVRGDGLIGQFCIGLLLGLVWSPCVGPTLGAATTLASQGTDLGHIALLMALFGLGAGLPLMILGGVSRASFARVRGALSLSAKFAKVGLGTVFVVLGVLMLTGLDRSIEAAALAASPMWLTVFTTAF